MVNTGLVIGIIVAGTFLVIPVLHLFRSFIKQCALDIIQITTQWTNSKLDVEERAARLEIAQQEGAYRIKILREDLLDAYNKKIAEPKGTENVNRKN